MHEQVKSFKAAKADLEARISQLENQHKHEGEEKAKKAGKGRLS